MKAAPWMVHEANSGWSLKHLLYSKTWFLEVAGLRPRKAKTCCREDGLPWLQGRLELSTSHSAIGMAVVKHQMWLTYIYADTFPRSTQGDAEHSMALTAGKRTMLSDPRRWSSENSWVNTYTYMCNESSAYSAAEAQALKGSGFKYPPLPPPPLTGLRLYIDLLPINAGDLSTPF